MRSCLGALIATIIGILAFLYFFTNYLPEPSPRFIMGAILVTLAVSITTNQNELDHHQGGSK